MASGRLWRLGVMPQRVASDFAPMDSIVQEQWVARYMVSPLSMAALPEYIPAMLSAMSLNGVKSPFEAEAIASE